MSTHFDHQAVLLNESIEYLNLKPGAVVVDGTVGGGGHAAAILERIQPRGVLIGLDLDPDALGAARERLADFASQLHLVHASFRELTAVLRDLQIDQVDGILLDLGVSSHQLDVPARGFRFSDAEQNDTPLDMRMDPTSGATAAELLRHASAAQLQLWFQEYGQLPGSRRLAKAIVASRGERPIETSSDLLQVIREARVGGGRRHNPATLVFQALRIAVNDELSALGEALDAAIPALRLGGRIVVIAYHSLEDRVVKQCFRAAAKGCTCPPRAPVCTCGGQRQLRVLCRKPIRPGEAEVSTNPRARSALLRAAERIEEAA